MYIYQTIYIAKKRDSNNGGVREKLIFPFRYLGVPLLSSRLNICIMSHSLIKSIILFKAGIRDPYRMQAGSSSFVRLLGVWLVSRCLFSPSHNRLSQIYAVCQNFHWGKQDDGCIKPRMAWSFFCRPKKEGGLRLHCLRTWNCSLLYQVT